MTGATSGAAESASTDRACAKCQLRRGRGRAERKGRTPLRGAGPRDPSRLREGHDGGCDVTFETGGGLVLHESRTPTSVARRLQLTREQGITLRGSAGIVGEIFSKSYSPRPELGRAEPRPSRSSAGPPRRLGAGMARSGPAPSPRGPAPSARAEESAERRMPAPRSGRGANGGGEGGEGLCAAGARLAV
ncbi:uncharacterized protein ACIGJ3_006696 [Trichechus inunguis]